MSVDITLLIFFCFVHLFQGYKVYIAQDDKQISTTTGVGEKKIILHRGVQDPNKVVLVFEGDKAAMLQEEPVIKRRVVS